MENVFIKNANVIKKVELTKEILNKLNAGYEESLNLNASLGAEAEGLEAEIKEIKSNINALETQKKDLQQLISKGNTGLGVKLIEGTKKVIELKKELEEKGYEIVNTFFTDEWYSKEAMAERGVVQIPLCFLAKSLENMSLCHAAYFCKGWENARGCRIEHEAAVAYGLEILYEE